MPAKTKKVKAPPVKPNILKIEPGEDGTQQPKTAGPAAAVNAGAHKQLQLAYNNVVKHTEFSGIQSQVGGTFGGQACIDDINSKGYHRFEGNVFMIQPLMADDASYSQEKMLVWKSTFYRDNTGVPLEALEWPEVIRIQGGAAGHMATGKGAKLFKS